MRNADRRSSVANRLFSVAATGKQSHHSVTYAPSIDVRGNFDHFARAFESEDGRGAGRRRIVSFALQKIGAIEGRRVNTNANRTLYEQWSVDISNV